MEYKPEWRESTEKKCGGRKIKIGERSKAYGQTCGKKVKALHSGVGSVKIK
ncbi:hypothetical protein C1H46_008686 [Malus baccata]|uniref:Uncharacterized protein n=1 Tax=Malus baccata TaxID=106549 RepID=A0A540N3N6_MALBA|nr:hypothetical protein C1H46_008686 [Malus baccata]